MIIAYRSSTMFRSEIITPNNKELLHEALWIDMLCPLREEELLVEEMLNLDVPTREEMQNLEVSNRLFKENDTLFMTATMIAKSETPNVSTSPVTMILTGHKLITVRYVEPQAFTLFISRLQKFPLEKQNAVYVLVELLESAIERLADILEKVGSNIEQFSQALFLPKREGTSTSKVDYRELLQKLGASGHLNSETSHSLITFNRLLIFFQQAVAKIDPETQTRLATLTRDVTALSVHATYQSEKVNFLLDATLGMVSLEQNNIMKIFSIMSVVFSPPTLIAGIYGMNFAHMPELHSKAGYPLALCAIVVSALFPYLYCKYKKWI